jgi:hypothetical protein
VSAADSIGRVYETALLFPSFVRIILTVQTAELRFFKIHKGMTIGAIANWPWSTISSSKNKKG